MSEKRQQDYLAKHRLIREKLVEIVNEDGRGCVNVIQLAKALKMDVRTVRAHLESMEKDSIGIFMDSSKQQFCTKEGIAQLSNALKISRGDFKDNMPGK